jgi:transcriptional regulator with XRE-family HTH domain
MLESPQRAGLPKAAVVTKAVLRAMRLLELSQQELAGLLHVSPATASRWANGQSELTPESAEGQLALLFLRVFRSLDTLVGGDAEKARAWLQAPNRHLGGIPLARLKTPEGLVHVAEYLDAMRGKA